MIFSNLFSVYGNANITETGREAIVGIGLQTNKRRLGRREAAARGVGVGVFRCIDAVQVDRNHIAAYLDPVLVPDGEQLAGLRVGEVARLRCGEPGVSWQVVRIV